MRLNQIKYDRSGLLIVEIPACQCADIFCPAHQGQSSCRAVGKQRLYRIDMADDYGTMMCDACADDANNSGLFSDIRWNDRRESK